MSQTIPFLKMHGLGNDFVVIDERIQSHTLSKKHIQHIADRHHGIGCDQVLLINAASEPNIDMTYRIYNGDGSEAEQCGNGARCIAKYLFEQDPSKKALHLQTITSTVICEKADNDIRVNMGVPECRLQDIVLPFQEQLIELHALSIGNPHAVTIVETLDNVDVPRLGASLAHHKEFPHGVNVEFMQLMNETEIQLRVFERGTGETLACGSGACAAAMVARLKYHLKPALRVHLKGGTLSIEWEGKGEPIYMTGPAETVFTGTFNI